MASLVKVRWQPGGIYKDDGMKEGYGFVIGGSFFLVNKNPEHLSEYSPAEFEEEFEVTYEKENVDLGEFIKKEVGE